MVSEAMLARIGHVGAEIWRELILMYPTLNKAKEPIITINNRLYKTAGQCYRADGIVELGGKFFGVSPDYDHYMLFTVLPHEIIHYADYVLNGAGNKKCGHGTTWKTMMVQYGLEPNPFHYMTIERSSK